MFVLIITFGLWPFNFWPTNQVEWLQDENGVHFFGRGIICSEASIPFAINPSPDPINPTPYTQHPFVNALHPFSIEIWLQPGKESYNYTARILSLYDGQGIEKIVLSQWKSGLIVQKRIQDRPEESYPKVGIKDALPNGVKRFLTVTSGLEGTMVYIDGRLAGKYPKFHLLQENDSGSAQLLLGNSVRGKQHWNGNLYGLAIYNQSLTGEQVLRHFQCWAKREELSLLQEEKIIAFYPFHEHSGTLVHDQVSGHHLFIPSRFEVVQKTILTPPWKDFRLNRSYLMDILTNTLGFIPFGFFFSAYLWIKKPRPVYRLFLISILFVGFTSFTIELAQVYLPTRSSQLMDIITNILGSAVGVSFFYHYHRRSLRPFV